MRNTRHYASLRITFSALLDKGKTLGEGKEEKNASTQLMILIFALN
jgi:hypothetical protein